MNHNEDKQGDAGNILEPSKKPLRVYGNAPKSTPDNGLGLALLAGLGIGLGLVLLNTPED